MYGLKEVGQGSGVSYMSQSLNSLKGGFIGDHTGLYVPQGLLRGIVTRSFDNRPYQDSEIILVVSQNRGTPIWTPIYYNPYYKDPQKGYP